MIQIEKDDAIVRNGLAIIAFIFQSAVFLSADCAPGVNYTVIPPADIFLVASLIKPLHFTICIIWFCDQALYNLPDPFVTGRVGLFYFFQFF